MINDTHSHEVGDVVLKAVSKTILRVVRQSDAVGRIGGEEFSVFLPDTDQVGAIKLAEHMREQIENLMPQVGSQSIRITASIGIATADQAGENMAAIQRRADYAMYNAKQLGRNRVSCFNSVQ